MLPLLFWYAALDRDTYYIRQSNRFQDAMQSWNHLYKKDIFPTYSMSKSFFHSSFIQNRHGIFSITLLTNAIHIDTDIIIYKILQMTFTNRTFV